MSTQLFAVAMVRAARSLRLRFTVLLLVLLVVDGGTNAKPSAQVVDTLPPQVPTSCPKTEHTVTTATQLITELSSGFSGTIVIPSGVTIDLGETRDLYSSAGRTEWRFLLPSTLRVADLRFGRFNRDTRTDVLFSDGVAWWVSMSGTGLPRRLRADGRPLADCVFGHFDDDGITDVLWANGSRWFVSSGGVGPWTELRASSIRAANLRVGDFTGDGIDDVFWITNNRWRLWDTGSGELVVDDSQPVVDSDIGRVVVADFDNDGRTDLAKTEGHGWNWLRTGSNVWEPLRDSGGQPEYSDVRAALFGRFSWTRRIGAIRYASPRFATQFRSGFVIWNGMQDAFVPWTPGGQEMR